jgi:hypothetical protein
LRANLGAPGVPPPRGRRRQLGTRLNYRFTSFASTSSTAVLASARAGEAGAAFLRPRVSRLAERALGCPRRTQGEPRWRECGALPLFTRGDNGARFRAPDCATISQVTSTPAEAPQLRDLALLRRARDQIDREYAHPLDVEALAREAHMSAGHFRSQFRLAYGESRYSY